MTRDLADGEAGDRVVTDTFDARRTATGILARSRRIDGSAVDFRQRPSQVYRLFDIEGRLLYVGVSVNAHARLEQHRRDKPWAATIARIDVTEFATRHEAEDAEAAAIRDESPIHNIVKNQAVVPRACKAPPIESPNDMAAYCLERVEHSEAGGVTRWWAGSTPEGAATFLAVDGKLCVATLEGRAEPVDVERAAEWLNRHNENLKYYRDWATALVASVRAQPEAA